MVNWDKPIEAVREDGRTMPVSVDRTDYTGVRINEVAWGDNWFTHEGAHFYGSTTRIRNIEQPATVAPELVERMVDFFKRYSASHHASPFATEARAIMTELEPKPESDEDAAERFALEWAGCDHTPVGLERVIIEAFAWARANPR